MTHGVKEKQAQCRFLVYIALLGFYGYLRTFPHVLGTQLRPWRRSGRHGHLVPVGQLAPQLQRLEADQLDLSQGEWQLEALSEDLDVSGCRTRSQTM